MELGLSLGDAMADAGRELVLGLGVGGSGSARREERGRRDLEVATAMRCGSSPEPTMRLALLPMAPTLGFPWPSESRHLEASTRGFDVNQAPSCGASAWGAYAAAAADDEQEDGAAAGAAVSSSPNDSGGSFPMDFSAHGERGASDAAQGGGGGGGGSRGSDEDDGGSARKKLRLSKEQAAFLEESFKEHSTLNPRQKVALAKQLNLRPRQVEVWFQNRRARTKLKQTEVDCEYLKRCCETLTEENRRLQKELAELRALKTVHPFYMNLPATTLSMCPSCERVASSSAPSSSAAAAPERSPSSFAALFSSARSFPMAAQPQTQAPSS
ncbi:hypothetical protein ACQ4PT_064313 [Festuca glaucescens]